MQHSTKRRIFGYSGAGVAVAALVWAGWGRDSDAAPGTLIASASAQMQLAYGVVGDSANARALRTKLVADAEQLVARAELQAPDHPSVLVARGDLGMLKEQPDAALGFYDRAAAQLDEAEPLAMVLERRAQILVGLQRFDAAAIEVERMRAIGESKIETACAVLEATILEATDRRSEAVELMSETAKRGDTETSVRCGCWLETAGDLAAAERAFRAPSVDSHLADYHSARLKLRTGEIDTAEELLSRAIDQNRPEVLRLMQVDQEQWAVCRKRERFEQILGPDGTAAVPR